MNSPHSEIVLVLAAGRGRRMGTPKALMRVAGEPWWRRQLDAIDAAARDSVWVVSDRVRAQIETELGARALIATSDEDAPMFESLLAGIDVVSHQAPAGVFIQPVDVPVAGKPVLDALASGGRVVVPDFSDTHGHPIWLEWSWLRDAIGRRTEDRLDNLTADERVHVEVHDPRVAMNLNSPEDVRAYEAFLVDQDQ